MNAVEQELRRELGAKLVNSHISVANLGDYLATKVARESESAIFGRTAISIYGERTADFSHAKWEAEVLIKQLSQYGIAVDGTASQLVRAIAKPEKDTPSASR